MIRSYAEIVEAVSALGTIAFAVWLSAGLAQSAPVTVAMVEIAPLPLWSLAFMVAALWQLLLWRRPRWRAYGALLLAALWLFVAVVTARALAPATPLYVVLSLEGRQC